MGTLFCKKLPRDIILLKMQIYFIWGCFISVPSFRIIALTVLKLQKEQVLHTKNYKGALFCKNGGEVTVLVLCTVSDDAL